MKHQGVKAVREMSRMRSPRDKGTATAIVVTCYDNGMWSVNGDPCQDDLTAVRVVAQCMESLATERDQRKAAA